MLNSNATMSEIIDDNRGYWKEDLIDLISQIFKLGEAETICSIPVSQIGAEDKLI